MFTLRKVVISLITLLFLLSVFALILDYWMGWKTEKSIYTEISAIPAKNVGVVLGTAKYLVAGGINQYYQNRIDGAVDLYNAGKINYILVSGDNAQNSYNEPRVMRLDLIEAGIPKEKIVLDFAGFRTLDSVVRVNKVFVTDDFTIITQQFHCERALFIAEHMGIHAQCFAVALPENRQYGLVRAREVIARLGALADLYILNRQPRFLGPQIPVGKKPTPTPKAQTQPATPPKSDVEAVAG